MKSSGQFKYTLGFKSLISIIRVNVTVKNYNKNILMNWHITNQPVVIALFKNIIVIKYFLMKITSIQITQ